MIYKNYQNKCILGVFRGCSGLTFSKYLRENFFFYTNLSIAKTLYLHITGRHLIASFIFMTELISPKEKDKGEFLLSLLY